MAEAAIFPGSFDPMTLGHKDIIVRSLGLFEKVYVAIGQNTTKNYLLPFESRQYIVDEIFENEAGVEVIGYQELTVDLCRRLGVKYIVRGLRSSTDFEYERNIALMNSKLAPEIETVFFISDPAYSGVTSTIVREIHKYGGDISAFVPQQVLPFLGKK